MGMSLGSTSYWRRLSRFRGLTIALVPRVAYDPKGAWFWGWVGMSYLVVGAVVVSLFAGSLGYERTSSEFVVAGEASRSCGEYIEAIKAERTARPPDAVPGMRYTALYAIFVAVTDGFLTGINYVDRERAQLGKVSDAHSRMTWLEGYCKTNPSAGFIEALQFLRIELIKKGT
jgi:hypothetical protein